MEGAVLKTHIERLHSESYGWALSCCYRDSHDAEVVLQTVYLKILEGRARFDGRSSFKTWLFSVIRKTAADHRRRNLLHRLRLARVETNSNPGSSHPDERLYKSEIQTLFRNAIAVLPKRQREVVQLVFYHDLTLREAAEVMRVSLGSARTHYDRGKRQLRKLLEDSGAFYEERLGRQAEGSL
jgi:RNA polymerase sigma-70 factor (ECF subfamily)